MTARMLGEMVACPAPGAWWPIVLVSVLVGIAIGAAMVNWFWRDTLREQQRRMHPSSEVWTTRRYEQARERAREVGRVDGGGRGEMWEDHDG